VPEEKSGSGMEHKQGTSEQKSGGTGRSGSAGTMTDSSAVGSISTTSLVTSAALIGVGALMVPEMLAGMALGAGAVLVSGLASTGLLRPMVKTVVKAGYAAAIKTQEFVAEASEDVRDIVAEARSDYHRGA